MASPAHAARLQSLNDALSRDGVLRLREAAQLLQVSEMTVRRAVSAHPEMFAYLGGYIVKASDLGAGSGYNLQEEERSQALAKSAACAHACSLIGPEDTVFIDCGTTLEHLALQLPPDLPVTVICYSLNLATRLASKSAARLVMLGGLFHQGSAAFVSANSCTTLAGFGITKAFISAGGIDAQRGVSCSNMYEVPIKQQAIRSAHEKYLVADSSKFNRLKPALFASLSEFDAIISEKGIHRQP
ncbi:DeoR/GlpR family DNA-binding transcription regulator [Variovorax rhizosphaerae]|uniref:DeoR/GlpR family DNA-binding transcription regulator n=1 Tax=Variovorax rhizosphaerae TaxID=1836200 RepID=A0ABU8WME4_9BURK